MPSRPGGQPDPAEELLGRWQAHHAGTPGSSGDGPLPEETPPAADPDESDEPAATTPAAGSASDHVEPVEPADRPASTAAPVLAARHAPSLGTTTDVEFPPRMLLRRILGGLTGVTLVSAAGAGLLAYDDPTTLTVGVAGTLAVLTLVLYGLRVSAAPARVAIHAGQLEVVRGSTREVFDLTSRFTRMEVVGKPGRPGWKVLMGRFGRDPLVIDSSMVDPAQFTAALERHRPR
ncbi:hypothetical protein ABFT23_11695 [Nocardioides sp. C4-1]|uniref:hypothetical protein n=1 Tax=Nocardioides sp. C4-1 TaxID=3151851 RepID=UPI0032674B2C